MATKRFIEIKNGVAVNECVVGRDSFDPEHHTTPPNMIEVPMDDGVSYIGRPYTAKDGFGEKAPVVERLRLVSHDRYFDLFTFAERSATFALLDAGDARVRDLWARVQLGSSINLISPRVAAGLAYLKSKDVFGKDAAPADVRIAAIIANQDPS